MTHLNVLIGHTNVVCIGSKILRCSHHGKLNSSLISEGLIGPFSDRSDFFHSSNAVVCNKDLDLLFITLASTIGGSPHTEVITE